GAITSPRKCSATGTKTLRADPPELSAPRGQRPALLVLGTAGPPGCTRPASSSRNKSYTVLDEFLATRRPSVATSQWGGVAPGPSRFVPGPASPIRAGKSCRCRLNRTSLAKRSRVLGDGAPPTGAVRGTGGDTGRATGRLAGSSVARGEAFSPAGADLANWA